MRSIVLILFFAITVLSCKDSNTDVVNANPENVQDSIKGKLSVNDISNPRTATDTNASSLGTLVFADTLHDFGNIKEGDLVTYDFNYKNTGKKAVIITEARASCGCTVPEYTQEPIAPGQSGILKVKFNSEGKPGPNYKNVTIKSNANPGEQDIAIKAMVN